MTKSFEPSRKQRRVVGILSLDTGESVFTAFPPSIVDSSQYESLADIVAKYNRGEPILSSSRVDAVVMDDAPRDPESILSDMSVMRESGADLVDASAALRRGEEAKIELNEAKKSKDAKDKSERDAKDEADKAELKKLKDAEAARTKAP